MEREGRGGKERNLDGSGWDEWCIYRCCCDFVLYYAGKQIIDRCCVIQMCCRHLMLILIARVMLTLILEENKDNQNTRIEYIYIFIATSKELFARLSLNEKYHNPWILTIPLLDIFHIYGVCKSYKNYISNYIPFHLSTNQHSNLNLNFAPLPYSSRLLTSYLLQQVANNTTTNKH